MSIIQRSGRIATFLARDGAIWAKTTQQTDQTRDSLQSKKAPHRRSGEGQSSISVTVSALLFMETLDSQEYRLAVQASLAQHIDRSLPPVRPLGIPQHRHAVAAVRALYLDHNISRPYVLSWSGLVLTLPVSIAPDAPSAYQPVPSLTQVLASIQPSRSK